MRIALLSALTASAIFLTGCNMTKTDTEPAVTASASANLTPPVAKREPFEITQVGRTRNDPYHWLKDDDWQTVMTDPDVLRTDIRGYLEAENAFTKTVLEDPTTALREELFNEMRGRIKEADASLPDIDGAYAYLTKYREGGEYMIFARRPAADIYADDATDEILLDGDKLGEGKAFFSFGALGHSPDHKLVAYAYDDQGSEIYDIKFRDLATGEDLPDIVTGTAGDFTGLRIATRSIGLSATIMADLLPSTAMRWDLMAQPRFTARATPVSSQASTSPNLGSTSSSASVIR